MKLIQLSIEIQARPETIWAAIISVNKYKIWTKSFNDQSTFEGIWLKGNLLKFYGIEPDGSKMGMICEVAEYDHLKFLSLRPKGLIQNGEDNFEPEVLSIWADLYENYTIIPIDAHASLFKLEQYVPDDFYEQMSQQWLPALEALKGECEHPAAPFNSLTIEATVDAPIERVWDYWVNPDHIIKWNFASPDWHCPKASVDLRVGGLYSATMAARDGSFGFDFGAFYTEIVPHQKLVSQMGDGRMIHVTFESLGPDSVHIIETFEAEGENTLDLQKNGWQAILNNYKKAVEEAL